MEKLHDNLKDSTPDSSKSEQAGISPSNETGAQIAQTVSKLQEGIRNDAGISPDILQALKQQIQEAKEQATIEIAGERFSLKDLPEGTDIKEQLDICNQILSGNYDNHSKLKLLPVKVAKHLANHQGDLFLHGLTSLTPEVAAHLAKHEGGNLYLNGLTSLTPEVAKHLANHQGDLFLDGLTSLTPETAEHLAKRQGNLFLSGLTSLTPETSEHLAKHKGGLSLNGLTSLTPEAAEHLAYRRAGKVGSGDTCLSSEAESAVEEATERLKQAGKL